MRKLKLLKTLILRGDLVSLERGRLSIIPRSGCDVPKHWINQNREEILCQILSATGLKGYIYRSHQVGKFGQAKAAGLDMQFVALPSMEPAYTIFNVDIRRLRNTLHGRKGDPLPKGQFRVGEFSHFHRFWYETGLRMPPSKSRFYKYMGNLKEITFTAVPSGGERLSSGSVRPLEISYEEIKTAVLRQK